MRPSCSREPAAWVDCDGGALLVLIAGEHDLATVSDVSAVMAVAIASQDGDVAVDLSGVTFMDAALVGVLIRSRSFLAQRSRSLFVRSPSRQARRVLDLCGVLGLLEEPPEVPPGPAEAAMPSAEHRRPHFSPGFESRRHRPRTASAGLGGADL